MTWTFLDVTTLQTELTEPDLLSLAASMGLGEDQTTRGCCRTFQDQIHGQEMREIGRIYYSPAYRSKRGGSWRIEYFDGVTPADRRALLHLACSYMARGAARSIQGWKELPFSDPKHGSFWHEGVCRPLSDYTGDELFTMVSLPEDIDFSTHADEFEQNSATLHRLEESAVS